MTLLPFIFPVLFSRLLLSSSSFSSIYFWWAFLSHLSCPLLLRRSPASGVPPVFPKLAIPLPLSLGTNQTVSDRRPSVTSTFRPYDRQWPPPARFLHPAFSSPFSSSSPLPVLLSSFATFTAVTLRHRQPRLDWSLSRYHHAGTGAGGIQHVPLISSTTAALMALVPTLPALQKMWMRTPAMKGRVRFIDPPWTWLSIGQVVIVPVVVFVDVGSAELCEKRLVADSVQLITSTATSVSFTAYLPSKTYPMRRCPKLPMCWKKFTIGMETTSFAKARGETRFTSFPRGRWVMIQVVARKGCWEVNRKKQQT